jgi:hypothetical protein
VVLKTVLYISIEAERVVMAVGNQSDNRLYRQIALSGYEIHRIGDCVEPRSIKQAIYEGTVVGGNRITDERQQFSEQHALFGNNPSACTRHLF